MKKISICMSVCALLSACEYSEADRAKFYEMCMHEEIGSTTLKNLAAYCACFNWARSEDIDPENKDIQLSAAYEKCYSEPFEFTPEQKRAFIAECVALFTEEYPSYAEQLAFGGMPVQGIMEFAGAMAPFYNIYTRSNNRDDIQCACNRVSNLDDFRLPRDHRELEERVKESLKVCLED